MKTVLATKNLSLPARRRVELAIAVAQERLLGTHVAHALELIELVGDQVPFDEALDIYNRLLRITAEEERIVTTRALAILGARTDEPRSWPERMAEADAAAEEAAKADRKSLLNHLRSRIKGRIQDHLRHWIELEAARTEVALIDAHVINALYFVSILDNELPLTEAVELYLEALAVRDTIAEVVYYFALAKLNDKVITNRNRAQAIPVAPTLAIAAEETALRAADAESA